MTKIGRNDACPCGSGRKFKKCCGAPGAAAKPGVVPCTLAERAAVLGRLDRYVEESLAEEEEEAFLEMWGRHEEREAELPPDLLSLANSVHDAWFAFDYLLDDGTRAVDRFLASEPLTAGQRSFLLQMRQSTMRLYEVMGTVPGTSVTLSEVLDGGTVTVNERSASRSLTRGMLLAARVIPLGCSGGPEMEHGLFHIPNLYRSGVVSAVQGHVDAFLRDNPGEPVDEAYKELPPFFLDAWLSSIFEPAVPTLQNTDGEETVVTRVSFHVEDPGALERRLGAAGDDGIEPDGEGRWTWAGENTSGQRVTLGLLEVKDVTLTVECNSVARGERARVLVERLAGPAVAYRGTVHQDLQREVAERVTQRALGRAGDDPPSRGSLDPALAQAVVLQQYAQHYRAWVDEPVPALDGQTPRAAAASASLRPRVEALLRELEGMYEGALKDGAPAYDPSWMWSELGLREEPRGEPPPALAHERVAERVPGSAEASRAAAERVGRRRGSTSG